MLREILQVLRSEYAFALFTASFAGLAPVIAFAIVGYLGLAILGILTLLICAPERCAVRQVMAGSSFIPIQPPKM